MKGEPCVECQRPNTRGGQWCSACYMRLRYFADPVHGAERRAANKARVVAYDKAHPEKHRVYHERWLWHQLQGTVRTRRPA